MAPARVRLLVLLLALGCRERPQGPAPSGAGTDAPLAGQDCVVVLLDALDARELSCYGETAETSPFIDRLAAEGVRFARAWSQTSWTLPSTASLMTGLYQETHGVQTRDQGLPAGVPTLAEAFGEAGYETAAFVQNPFAGARHGLHRGFDDFVEAYRMRASGERIVDMVLERLDAPRRGPRFVYVHLRRPHTPHDADERHLAPFLSPDYEGPVTGSNADVERHNKGEARLAEADLRRMEELYHGNIRHADAQVGRLLSGLDLERTLVVVLSDHGEALGQHGKLGHNWLSYEEYVHVPVVMRHPELPGGLVVETPVMTIDLFPTLVELFGLSAPAAVQGASWVPLLEGGAWRRAGVFTSSRVQEGEGRRQLAVSDGRFKLVRTVPSGREALFDLVDDPLESVDVADEHPQVAARLSGLLDEWQRSTAEAAHAAGAAESMDAQMEEHLRELGYLR